MFRKSQPWAKVLLFTNNLPQFQLLYITFVGNICSCVPISSTLLPLCGGSAISSAKPTPLTPIHTFCNPELPHHTELPLPIQCPTHSLLVPVFAITLLHQSKTASIIRPSLFYMPRMKKNAKTMAHLSLWSISMSVLKCREEKNWVRINERQQF